MKTKVTIELVVDGDVADVDQALDSLLDSGEFQDAINDYPDADLNVESCVVVTCQAVVPSNGKARACSEGGYCVFAPDLEYDATGETINCEKCGEPP